MSAIRLGNGPGYPQRAAEGWFSPYVPRNPQVLIDKAQAMKPSRFILPAAMGILGLMLGVGLAPVLRKTGNGWVSGPSAVGSQPVNSAEAAVAISRDGGKTNDRTRARERTEDKKPTEPRVSIPLRTLVQVLKKGDFSYSSQFDSLNDCMEKALILLGATENEQQEIKNLIEHSMSEILAAEKSQLALGEVSADVIYFDTSAMRRPVEEIIEQTKHGIRAALPGDLATSLIESIAWDRYYPIDGHTRLEINRGSKGELMAWARNSSRGSGTVVDRQFKDDGTPLPAELIFGERWRPFLKGVTILPRDEP